MLYSLSNQTRMCVYLSGWQRFSAIHNVNWDPDRSSIPSLANALSASWQFRLASLLSPLALLFSSLQLSSPALPGAPLRILLRSRPLSPKASPNPLHRLPWEFPPQHSRPRSSALTLFDPEQPALLTERDWENRDKHITCVPSTDGSCWCDVIRWL